MNPKPPGLTRLRVDRFLLATGICLLWGLAPAYGASVERKKEELQDLKGRIEALRRDMAAAEESRAHAADQLREVESAISTANRRLHELGLDSAALKAELAELDAEGRRLDRQGGAQ
ncbi:MAG: hypothetical protein KA806_10910, partial [Sulfuritalea sp.]|nr:hypothetical protein [Sulfuritalea sp.]